MTARHLLCGALVTIGGFCLSAVIIMCLIGSWQDAARAVIVTGLAGYTAWRLSK